MALTIIHVIVTFLFIEFVGLTLGTLGLVLADFRMIKVSDLSGLLFACVFYGFCLTAIPSALYSLISTSWIKYADKREYAAWVQYAAGMLAAGTLFVVTLMVLRFQPSYISALAIIQLFVVMVVSMLTTLFQKSILT